MIYSVIFDEKFIFLVNFWVWYWCIFLLILQLLLKLFKPSALHQFCQLYFELISIKFQKARTLSYLQYQLLLAFLELETLICSLLLIIRCHQLKPIDFHELQSNVCHSMEILRYQVIFNNVHYDLSRETIFQIILIKLLMCFE